MKNQPRTPHLWNVNFCDVHRRVLVLIYPHVSWSSSHTHCFHTERPLVFRSHPLRPLRDIIGWSAPGGPSFWLLESLLPKNTRFRWSCFAPIAGAIWWCPWSGSHFQWVSSIQGATCSGLRDEADASLSVTWRSFSLLGSIFPLLVQGEWHPTITHFFFLDWNAGDSHGCLRAMLLLMCS